MGTEATSSPFLTALSDDDARDLRALGRARSYAPGDAIFHQGDEPAGVHFMLSGRVKVSMATSGGKNVILAFRGPGDILGELSAIGGGSRTTAVRAIEPVGTLFVSTADFLRFLDTHPRASMNLVLVLIERLRYSDDGRLEFAAHDVVGRVARRLVELCERFGETAATPNGAVEVPLALSQEELASWTVSSREAVVKAVRLLRELGWIETRRRRIVVRDLDALRRYAD